MTAFRKDKMEQAILYFCERINNVYLGKTKLMKLLYYLDFDHMEEYGTPVTGGTYKKLPHGPVPMEAFDLIAAMDSAHKLKEKRITGPGGYPQHRFLATAPCERSVFSSTEWDTLEKVATRWENSTAEQISKASHAETPWKVTEEGEKIDYRLALYRTPDEEEGEDSTLKKILSSKVVREGIRSFAKKVRVGAA